MAPVRLLVASLLLTAACSGEPSPAADPFDDADGDAMGDGKEDGTSHCDATSPRSKQVELSVTPDAGEAPVVAVLEGATRSIRVMVYILDAGDILDTLEAKAAKIPTRVILDRGEQPTNQAAFDRLTTAGAQVQWSDPKFSFMHAKIAVVDTNDSIVATGNFSKKLIGRERNYLAHDSDRDDVRALARLFDADWKHVEPNLTCTRLLVSPVNSKARMLDLLHGAKATIDVESMQLADDDVREALADAAGADVPIAVRPLLAAASWIKANASAAIYLGKQGIADVRYMTTPMVHVKNILVDGRTDDPSAYLGSENLSLTSLTKNREVGLVLTKEQQGLGLVADTFDADWEGATAF